MPKLRKFTSRDKDLATLDRKVNSHYTDLANRAKIVCDEVVRLLDKELAGGRVKNSEVLKLSVKWRKIWELIGHTDELKATWPLDVTKSPFPVWLKEQEWKEKSATIESFFRAHPVTISQGTAVEIRCDDSSSEYSDDSDSSHDEPLDELPVVPYDRHMFDMIEVFNGDPFKFHNFMSMFVKAVDRTDLDVAFKLSRLRAKLIGRPLRMIENYPVAQYEKAKTVLKNKYTNPVFVVSHLRKKVSTLPVLRRTGDLETFDEIVETIRAISETIKALKIDLSVEIGIFREILPKLPTELTEHFTDELGDKTPRLDAFVVELDRKLKGATNRGLLVQHPCSEVSQGTSELSGGEECFSTTDDETEEISERSTPKQRQVRSNRRQDFSMEDILGSPCAKCESDSHSFLYCGKVSPRKKDILVRKYGLCFLCMEGIHLARDCQADKIDCEVCGDSRHHRMLCFREVKNPKGEESYSSEDSAEDSHAEDEGSEFDQDSDDSSDGYVYALESVGETDEMMPVKIEVNGTKLDGRVDTGATVNLLPFGVARRLGLHMRKVKQTLCTPQGVFVARRATDALVRIGQLEHRVPFVLCSEQKAILLGTQIIQLFKLAVTFSLQVFQLDGDSQTFLPLTEFPDREGKGLTRGEELKTLKFSDDTLVVSFEGDKENFGNTEIPFEEPCGVTTDSIVWIEFERLKLVHENLELSEVPREVKRLVRNGRVELVHGRGEEEMDFLPNDIAREVLGKLHLNTDHMGFHSLVAHFRVRYYNPDLDDLVEDVLEECETCRFTKFLYHRYGNCGSIGPARRPFEIVHLVLVSGVCFTGFKMILAIDDFTRFIWAIVSQTEEPADYIEVLDKVRKVGDPQIVMANSSSAMTEVELRQYLKSRKIRLSFHSARSTDSGKLEEQIRQMLFEAVLLVKIEVPRIRRIALLMASIRWYNSSDHPETEFAPAYLLTGKYRGGKFSDEHLEGARRRVRLFASMKRLTLITSAKGKDKPIPDIAN